jgi:predicted MFS family arabinose efflux permease
VTAGTVLLVYAVVQAPTWTWGSAKTIGTGLAALVLLAVFVGVELRSQDPLVRMSIFRIRSLSVGNGALMLLGGASYALFLFASLYVQEIMGYSPMRGGLAFMPVFAGSVVGAVLAQRLILLIGTRAVSVIGLALSAGGMLLLLNLPVHGTYNGDLLGQLSVLSIGLGMSTVPLTLLSTSGVPAELSGLASGVNNMSQNVGRSLGLAVLTTVEVTHARDATHGTSPAALLSGQVAGFHAGFLGSAILLAAAIVLILALLRAKHTRAIDEGARSKKKPAGTADAVPTAG